MARDWTPATWSLNCLFVPARWRGRCVTTVLVAAAIEVARHAGAHEIATYPQAVAPGERQPGAFARTGVPSLHLVAGFPPLHAAPRGRGVYLLELPAHDA